MSNALLEMAEVVTRPQVHSEAGQQGVPDAVSKDRYPLVPVFIAIATSAILAAIFVGSILVWLALRNSGVMAP